MRPIKTIRRILRVVAFWRKHEIGKKITKPFRRGDNDVGEFRSEEVEMKPWLQSRTIHGLLASGVALLLGLFVSEADATSIAQQLVEWGLEGVQIGGLIYAARGRKLANGPLS